MTYKEEEAVVAAAAVVVIIVVIIIAILIQTIGRTIQAEMEASAARKEAFFAEQQARKRGKTGRYRAEPRREIRRLWVATTAQEK